MSYELTRSETESQNPGYAMKHAIENFAGTWRSVDDTNLGKPATKYRFKIN